MHFPPLSLCFPLIISLPLHIGPFQMEQGIGRGSDGREDKEKMVGIRGGRMLEVVRDALP